MSRSWIECSSSVPAPALDRRPARSSRSAPCTGMYWSSRKTTAITRPRLGRLDEVPGPDERRGAPQDQPDLVRDARPGDRVGHGLGRGEVGRQRLLAEHGQPPLGRRGHQAGVLGGPRADVDRVAAVEHLVLARAHDRAARGGEPGRPLRVGVVARRPVRRATPDRRIIFEWKVAISPAPRKPTRITGRVAVAPQRPSCSIETTRSATVSASLAVVGHVQPGDAHLLEEAAEVEGEAVVQLAVEGAERLVQQEQAGRRGERPGQRHPLRLAAGERWPRRGARSPGARPGRAARSPVAGSRPGVARPRTARNRRCERRRGGGTAGGPGRPARSAGGGWGRSAGPRRPTPRGRGRGRGGRRSPAAACSCPTRSGRAGRPPPRSRRSGRPRRAPRGRRTERSPRRPRAPNASPP